MDRFWHLLLVIFDKHDSIRLLCSTRFTKINFVSNHCACAIVVVTAGWDDLFRSTTFASATAAPLTLILLDAAKKDCSNCKGREKQISHSSIVHIASLANANTSFIYSKDGGVIGRKVIWPGGNCDRNEHTELSTKTSRYVPVRGSTPNASQAMADAKISREIIQFAQSIFIHHYDNNAKNLRMQFIRVTYSWDNCVLLRIAR